MKNIKEKIATELRDRKNNTGKYYKVISEKTTNCKNKYKILSK